MNALKIVKRLGVPTIVTVAGFAIKHRDKVGKARTASKIIKVVAKRSIPDLPTRAQRKGPPITAKIVGAPITVTMGVNRLGLSYAKVNVLGKAYKTFRGISANQSALAMQEAYRIEREFATAKDSDLTDLYWCPSVGEIESAAHGGFDVCCNEPGLHVPVSSSRLFNKPAKDYPESKPTVEETFTDDAEPIEDEEVIEDEPIVQGSTAESIKHVTDSIIDTATPLAKDAANLAKDAVRGAAPVAKDAADFAKDAAKAAAPQVRRAFNGFKDRFKS